MAKLFLKFEQAVLKEVPLSQGVVTIGRLPDNVIQIDNLAVSGRRELQTSRISVSHQPCRRSIQWAVNQSS